MKELTTLTTLQILTAAYTDILRRWVEESERNDRLRLSGTPNKITQSRGDKLWAQVPELHNEILRLEQAAS